MHKGRDYIEDCFYGHLFLRTLGKFNELLSRGSLGTKCLSEAGVLIRVLAEPKSSPYGQPTAVLSAAHSVEAHLPYPAELRMRTARAGTLSYQCPLRW